jgi:hypothetical protein
MAMLLLALLVSAAAFAQRATKTVLDSATSRAELPTRMR